MERKSFLNRIQCPADLRKLSPRHLPAVCEELRAFIIDDVSAFGGHFGGNLGVVELTVALHYVFDTPHDALVWDVGHQAYGHKILTGRRDRFHTKRLYKGLSGFPKRSESVYDAFGTGHSSTSISATLGMALASGLKGEKKHHVCVIGDGAMTGGMAFEAMNHAGDARADMLIVLNDNCMSIDPNVGALKEYLMHITVSPTYNKIKDEVFSLLSHLNKLGKSAQDIVSKLENSVKGFVTGSSNLFEALKLTYFGPTDGHDVRQLVRTLRDIKDLPGPKLLHCLTVKGKGFQQAEEHQTKWHATGTFDKFTGRSLAATPKKKRFSKYQEVFGTTLLTLARANEKIVGITPAMPSGCSMDLMMKEIPERVYDVGIAEQHAVTLSAGLATQGIIPFCNIYSTFMQRGYDQFIHDVCIQDLPVNLFLDRAGLVGSDGATHHGSFDIAYMRCLPNVILACPMDEIMLRNLMYTAQLPRPRHAFVVRYPRGEGMTAHWERSMEAVPIGKGRLLKEGQEVAILSVGPVGRFVLAACETLREEGYYPAAYDMCFAKPLDATILHEVARTFQHVITVEDGCVSGGFGGAVAEFMADHAYALPIKRLGIPDRFIEHGTQAELYEECHYDTIAIYHAVRACMGTKKRRFAMTSSSRKGG